MLGTHMVLYLTSDTSQWSIYNLKHYDETKQRTQLPSEAKTQENYNQKN